MIKLRLWGLPEEVAQAVQGLTPGSRCTLTLDVDSVSPPRADRGASVLVRVFVQARNVTSSTPTTTAAGTSSPTSSSPAAPPLAASAPPADDAPPLEIPGSDDA